MEKKKIPKRFFVFAAVFLGITFAAILAGLCRKPVPQKQIQETAGSIQSEKTGSRNEDPSESRKDDSAAAKKAGSSLDLGEKISGIHGGENVPATGAGANLDFDEYYWGGKRYTYITAGYLTEDMQWRDFIEIEGGETMEETMGYNYGGAAILLESYLEQHSLQADTATVLLDRYGGGSYGREEFYVQFDDEEETLVTFVYYKAQGEHGAYLDVLPCQYTEEEIEELKQKR